MRKPFACSSPIAARGAQEGGGAGGPCGMQSGARAGCRAVCPGRPDLSREICGLSVASVRQALQGTGGFLQRLGLALSPQLHLGCRAPAFQAPPSSPRKLAFPLLETWSYGLGQGSRERRNLTPGLLLLGFRSPGGDSLANLGLPHFPAEQRLDSHLPAGRMRAAAVLSPRAPPPPSLQPQEGVSQRDACRHLTKAPV